MYCLEDLKYNKLYKKQFLLPFNKEDKRHGSAILLLTPSYNSSLQLIRDNKFTLDRMRLFTAYYIERDIMYTINQESGFLEMDHPEYDNNGIILEGGNVYRETTDIKIVDDGREFDINELYCKIGDKVIFFNEMYDEDYLLEAMGPNLKYRQMLYNDRLRNNKSVTLLYDAVKQDIPWMQKMFINLQRYKKFNLFVDLYYYNQAYLQNNTFTLIKSIDMYFEFIRRFILDRRITDAGYTKKTVFVPIHGWNTAENSKIYDHKKNLNPISVLYKKLRFKPEDLNVFSGIDFVFFGNTGYFKFNPDNIDAQTYLRYMQYTDRLSRDDPMNDIEDDEEPNSSNAIAASIVSSIEKGTGATIDNMTGNTIRTSTDAESKRATLVKKINDVSKLSKDEEDALDKLEADKDVKRIIDDLRSDADQGGVKLSVARSNRINNAQDSFMDKQLDGKTIRDMINDTNKPKELPETSIPIETINDEWHHMKAINFEKEYDLDADIVRCINSLSDKDKSYPISILDITKQDTSTSEDSIYTYTVKCEGYNGQRFQFKFDLPKFRNNRFMRLRGNEKIFSIEMPLIPISKTSDSRTQVVTLYNKLFVDRYNTSTGKSNPYTDRLIKALSKYTGRDIKVINGDNSRICAKYNLPIDYIDLASIYSKIIYHSKELNENVVIYFNQDEIRKVPGISTKNGLPLAMSQSGKVLYYNEKADSTISQFIAAALDNPKFTDLYTKQSDLRRATYSRVWVLNTYIPTIVILAHDLGLIKGMDMANIKYDISSTPTTEFDEDYIKLKDGYINYKNTYSSMMLMNGLKDCNTENISIEDLNKKTTWIEQLENFGGRGKSDGLDNFKDLMFDPITVDICKDYKLPYTYHEALIYASNLLVDNKYTKHTDISSNRYRTNEIVAAQFYRVLSTSYREYANQAKHNRRNKVLTMKQSAVIDLILQQNNTSDLSVFQPLLEIETKNTISTKGVTGLNSDRAYTIDKRGYDKSMENVVAQSTGFASTVGVNRQTTIDPSIMAGRGYFKQSDVIKDGSVTRSMGMTEALTPFMTGGDDVFRNCMSFVQTAKHGTPVDNGFPCLITTGAQEAMPYLSSDMFAYKAKANGKISAITDEYMLIDYDNGTKDFIRLDEQTMKNSDGGFYITLQLVTDKKVGDVIKSGDIVAWDKKSFSKKVGIGQLSYNTGTLCKVAVLTSEDTYEDSGVCSEWLSDAMASDIVVMKSVVLPPTSNILDIVNKGQSIREGEPILIFQDAFDDEDANTLIKNLNVDDGDITTIGRNIIKSKVTGIISDIKIYRTCDLEDMTESMRKMVETSEAKTKRLKKILSSTISDARYDNTGKLPQVGKLKNVENGILIEIYMKYHDRLSIGDKLSSNANKNILMAVYSDIDAPYTDFRLNEQIDMITGASALDGRQITSVMKSGALNKCLIELQRACCMIYNKPWMTMHEMSDYVSKK